VWTTAITKSKAKSSRETDRTT